MSAPTSILTQALARCRAPFVAIAAFSAGVNILMLTAPLYMMQVYDRVLASRSFDTLMFLTILAVGAMAVLALLEAVRSRILTRANTFLEEALAPGIFERVIGATLQGRMYRADALRDLATVRGFLGGPGVTSLFDVPWIPIYVLVIFLIHPMIGWITVAGALLLFVLALVNELSTRRRLAAASVASMRAMRPRMPGSPGFAETISAFGLARKVSPSGLINHRTYSLDGDLKAVHE
jgi:ATP-binding cassette subfamily C protein/ATP-binding cassette subfamily C protein EexD